MSVQSGSQESIMNFNNQKWLAKVVNTVLLLSFVFFETAHSAPAGKTLMSRGDVQATDSNTSELRPLKRRSPVFDIDVVNTGEASLAQLRMDDGALIALKAQTQLKIEEYSYNQSGDDAVVMELISGGLRTITGEIKGSNANYKLKTPVGSIGIRGTHYEAEIIDNELFLAVWDGSINVEVIDNAQTPSIVLGKEGGFSYAKISKGGIITTLLKPPAELSALATTISTSSDVNKVVQQVVSQVSHLSLSEQQIVVSNLVNEAAQVIKDIEDSEFINEEALDSLGIGSIEELIAQRTGNSTYSVVDRSEVISSLGEVNSMDMTMRINFDEGLVEQGALTFKDAGGEWFAAFDGVINTRGLDLGVNFASHGQNLATGLIQTQFFDGLENLAGTFYLQEIEDQNTNAQGIFILSQP